MWAGAGMLREMAPLDAASLLDGARRLTGLTDFGEEDWREPFAVLLQSLEDEAELTLTGRLATRSELLLWLRTRLKLTELLKRHPEILDTPVEKPIFIAGLGRSGTSILQELLHQDPKAAHAVILGGVFPGRFRTVGWDRRASSRGRPWRRQPMDPDNARNPDDA